MICTSWPWERATEVPALESFNGRVLRDSGPRTPCGGGGSRPGARDGRGNVDGPLLALRVRHGYDRSSDPRSRNRPKVPKAQHFQGSRAFTAARQAKPGLFQAAHRGMIFLDEIGLLPEGLQAKLLKVIEERSVRRLGSTRSEPIDVWIVAATNEDLAVATRARRFREDLY